MQQGHTSDYVEVVRAYQQAIYRYCLRLLRNRQDAEDAVQDIFMKAYESIRLYRPTVSFSSWLYKIAYHHCLNVLRKRKRQFGLLPRLFGAETAAEGPEQIMDRWLFSPPLLVALTALTPEDRSLLILRVFEERTYEELGEIVGCKPEAAKKRVNRIKDKVRRNMEQFGEDRIWNEDEQSNHLKA